VAAGLGEAGDRREDLGHAVPVRWAAPSQTATLTTSTNGTSSTGAQPDGAVAAVREICEHDLSSTPNFDSPRLILQIISEGCSETATEVALRICADVRRFVEGTAESASLAVTCATGDAAPSHQE
jgi:hypothetical protein